MVKRNLQRTLRQEAFFEGTGLHTGRYSKVYLKPAPRDSGITFIRKDKGVLIKPSIYSVVDTTFATTIGYNGAKIRTVEHLLAGIIGLGIDNVLIEVDGPEIPILDGSAFKIIEVLLEAGIAKQSKERRYIRITKPVGITDGNAEVLALPYNGRMITYRIYFNHYMLGHQSLSVELNEKVFINEIAPARTFGFLKDVQYLQANGFAKGGSFDNAIILGDKEILNPSGLRFPDEFVRHKILDLIGDLSLIGYPIYGHIIANKSGHTTNLKFLKKLIAHPECWELVTSEVVLDSALVYT